MGWGSGSELLREVVGSARRLKKSGNLEQFCREVIVAFEHHDAELGELMGQCGRDFDKALKKLHPQWFEEDEDE